MRSSHDLSVVRLTPWGRGGEEPGIWSPYAYDSVDFLADGIEKSGGTEAAGLEKSLDAVSGWKGWTGSVTIDPKNGNLGPRQEFTAPG